MSKRSTSRRLTLTALIIVASATELPSQAVSPGTPGVTDYILTWTRSVSGAGTGPLNNLPLWQSVQSHSVNGYYSGSAELDIDGPMLVNASSIAGNLLIIETAEYLTYCPDGTAVNSSNRKVWQAKLLVPPPEMFLRLLPLNIFQDSENAWKVRSPLKCPYEFCENDLPAASEEVITGGGIYCGGAPFDVYQTNSATFNGLGAFGCLFNDLIAEDNTLTTFGFSGSVSLEDWLDPNATTTETCSIELVSLIGRLRLHVTADRSTTDVRATAVKLAPAKVGVPITVTITATRDGVPVGGQPVQLMRRIDYRRGGHRHAATMTDLGTTSSMMTDASGRATFVVQPGEIAGRLEFEATTPDPDFYTDKTHVDVRHPGLVELTGPFYFDIESHPGDGRSAHPVVAAFMQAVAAEVSDILDANVFLKTACGKRLQRLRINGISLKAGGLFDVNRDFIPPHHQHRVGNDVDIGVRGGFSLSTLCRNILYSAIAAVAGTNLDIEVTWVNNESPWACAGPEFDATVKCHWHTTIRIEDPPPPEPRTQDFEVAVKATVERRRESTGYNYNYAVRNQKLDGYLDRFALEFAGRPGSVNQPSGWVPMTFARGLGLMWAAIIPTSLSSVDDGVNIARGVSALSRGQNSSGFRFDHTMPPTISVYNVNTFTKIPQLRTQDSIADARVRRKVFEGTIRGYTLAPRTFRSQAMDLAADLSKDIDKMCEVGWIRRCDRSVGELRRALSAIRVALPQADTAANSGMFASYRTAVDRIQRAGLLNENASAVLRLSGAYLQETIQSRIRQPSAKR